MENAIESVMCRKLLKHWCLLCCLRARICGCTSEILLRLLCNGECDWECDALQSFWSIRIFCVAYGQEYAGFQWDIVGIAMPWRMRLRVRCLAIFLKRSCDLSYVCTHTVVFQGFVV